MDHGADVHAGRCECWADGWRRDNPSGCLWTDFFGHVVFDDRTQPQEAEVAPANAEPIARG